jgi:hypothetical protein
MQLTVIGYAFGFGLAELAATGRNQGNSRKHQQVNQKVFHSHKLFVS